MQKLLAFASAQKARFPIYLLDVGDLQ
jgi:hypothetical protein